MQIETPYRSNAASSLELRIIELGDKLEYLKEPDLQKFYTETTGTLKQFGYKRLYHYDLLENEINIICTNFYRLENRLIFLSLDMLKDNHTATIFGMGHYGYDICRISIYFSGKVENVYKIKKLKNPLKTLLHALFPGWFEDNNRRIFQEIIDNSYKIDNFRNFLTMF